MLLHPIPNQLIYHNTSNPTFPCPVLRHSTLAFPTKPIWRLHPPCQTLPHSTSTQHYPFLFYPTLASLNSSFPTHPSCLLLPILQYPTGTVLQRVLLFYPILSHSTLIFLFFGLFESMAFGVAFAGLASCNLLNTLNNLLNILPTTHPHHIVRCPITRLFDHKCRWIYYFLCLHVIHIHLT